jgi:hypothetical protein
MGEGIILSCEIKGFLHRASVWSPFMRLWVKFQGANGASQTNVKRCCYEKEKVITNKFLGQDAGFETGRVTCRQCKGSPGGNSQCVDIIEIE